MAQGAVDNELLKNSILLNSPLKINQIRKKHASKGAVGFHDEEEEVKHKVRRAIFRIHVHAMDEHHSVKVAINDKVKYDGKIIKHGKRTIITVSIEMVYLGLNNSLTIIDLTHSQSDLYIQSIEIEID